MYIEKYLCVHVQASEAVPYGADRLMTTSQSFSTLGIPDVSSQVALAAGYALKHAWYQNWAVHRRLRPEVYAQRMELFRSGRLGRSNGMGNPFKATSSTPSVMALRFVHTASTLFLLQTFYSTLRMKTGNIRVYSCMPPSQAGVQLLALCCTT